jgi:hypothetical protein
VPLRSPAETVASFKLMPGLQAEAVLHEPEVTQPLHLSFDERGRLWVVQFIQYPYPAGLKIVDVGDQFHATYQITTKDQRTLVGFIADRDNRRLVLRDPSGQQTTIAAGDLATQQVIPTSLMPEGLIEALKEQELPDLFAYLASTTDPTAK